MTRYIDKDELINRMQGKKSREWVIELCNVKEADVQEIKHGKWNYIRHYGETVLLVWLNGRATVL